MRDTAYFLSDLHLGAAYDPSSRLREKRIVAFLDSIKDEAREIFLLGDILDYWFEYKYVVPKGFVRLFGKLAELSDNGVEITWITGNHDIWIFDYLPKELGIKIVDSQYIVTLQGQKIFMAHGDRTGCDSRWFVIMQYLFRNKFLQRLFSTINPRWTIPFALRWSASSRQKPQLSSDAQKTSLALARLRKFCEDYLVENPGVRYFVFGHLHILAEENVASKSQMYVIGDWLTHFSYAKLKDRTLSMHVFEPY